MRAALYKREVRDLSRNRPRSGAVLGNGFFVQVTRVARFSMFLTKKCLDRIIPRLARLLPRVAIKTPVVLSTQSLAAAEYSSLVEQSLVGYLGLPCFLRTKQSVELRLSYVRLKLIM